MNFYFNLYEYIFIIDHKNIIEKISKNKSLNYFINVGSPINYTPSYCTNNLYIYIYIYEQCAHTIIFRNSAHIQLYSGIARTYNYIQE